MTMDQADKEQAACCHAMEAMLFWEYHDRHGGTRWKRKADAAATKARKLALELGWPDPESDDYMDGEMP